MISFLVATKSYAQTYIKVLAYPFPPFLNEDMKTGLSVDLVKLLNKSQGKYLFKLDVSSPKRRYRGIKEGLHDLVLFEMPEWGWRNKNIEFSVTKEIMTGGEVYITARKKGRTQEFFDNFKSKSISAYFGYHYGFAGYNSDRKWLQENFKIGLHTSHGRSIHLVSKGKVDIGVVTYSYLQKYLRENPHIASKLMISEKFDQHYSLPALIGGKSLISVNEFEAILNNLKKNGELQALFEKNGLLEQLTY